MPEDYNNNPAPEPSTEPAQPPKRIWTDAYAVAAWEETIRRACRDRAFREYCTGSSDNAKRALSETGNVEVPDRLRILFLDHNPDLDCAVVLLPPFKGNQEGPALVIDLEKLLLPGPGGYHPYTR